MTQTSIIAFAVCGAITGCAWALMWAVVNIARINAEKGRRDG